MLELLDRVLGGLLMGTLMAIGFSALTVVIYVVTAGAALDQQGISLLGLLGLYFKGGAAGGFVGGILWPAARWWPGAIVVGFASLLPLSLAIAAQFSVSGGLTVEDILASVVHAAVLGGPGGLYLRHLLRKNPIPRVFSDLPRRRG